jgi:hypothetical protein
MASADGATLITGNHASTSNDDVYGDLASTSNDDVYGDLGGGPRSPHRRTWVEAVSRLFSRP